MFHVLIVVQHCDRRSNKVVRLSGNGWFCFTMRSVDVFTITCGRSDVGVIGSVIVRLDGTDGWRVHSIAVVGDEQSFTIMCQDFDLDDSTSTTQEFYVNAEN